MNVHIVVEGEVEEKVYQSWVPLANSDLCYVEHVSLLDTDNFSIVSGKGYPQYFDIIERAIGDLNGNDKIDKLVVSVDSEEMSYQEKYDEISTFIGKFSHTKSIVTIIQHFCIEAWALGNRVIVRPNTQSPKLRAYKQVYNVRSRDPELLPAYKAEELNRAQFAEQYLRHALNDKYKKLTYTKRNPTALMYPKYYAHLKSRLEQTEHIKSFAGFLTAFV